MPEDGLPTNGLHIDLQTLDDLVAAYRTAKEQMVTVIDNVVRRAKIPSWTEDPISMEMAARFNDATFAGGYCTLEGLRAFESEFLSIVRTLTQMRAEYVRTEGDLAAVLRAIEGQQLSEPGFRPGGPQ